MQLKVKIFNAARWLIKDKRVQSILGLQTWVEAAVVADVGNEAQVPVLSFANSSPSWASERWPFLLQSVRNRSTLARAVSAMVSSWQWRRATVLYEDSDCVASSFILNLIEAIRIAGSDVDHQVAISPFAPISVELKKLNSGQSRIFVVHATPSLAVRLFAEALNMGMMEEGYVWITTDMISDSLDSLNSSVISSMQGILGVKTYFPQTAAFTGFSTRMQRRFRLEYPEEVLPHVDVLCLQTYDTVWTVAKAMERIEPQGNYSSYFLSEGKSSGDEETSIVFRKGHQLLERILAADFSGLSGRVQFSRGVLVPSEIFQIVNAVGKSYREMGYWTSGTLGFSRTLSPGSKYYNTSMATLGQVFWPGGSSVTPRGWAPTGAEPLKIGVSAISAFPDYVSAVYDATNNETLISGLAIDIFRAAVEYLPYRLPYELVAYNGTKDSLVRQVPMKVFDAVVGDTAILSYRSKLVQFSQPYTQSGYVMVVPLKPEYSNKAWIFTKPFKSSLWVTIGAFCLMNSLVVWIIERSSDGDQGSPSEVLGVSICLSLATLFNNGERVHSNLSRLVMVVWLFVGLVLTSNYTATLSSMLTVQRLKPSVTDIELLKRTDAVVGCNKGGSIVTFLQDFLGFPMSNIKQFSHMDEYVPTFRNGEIKAAMLTMGHSKMFLAKYCKEFTTAGPTYHAGGFGFIFPKGSPLVSDFSEAILKMFESGKMQEMENGVLSSYNCSESPTSDNNRLGLESFCGLFAVMVMTSVVALLFFYSRADPARRAAKAALSACARRAGEAMGELRNTAAALWGRLRGTILPAAVPRTTVAECRTDWEMGLSGLPPTEQGHEPVDHPCKPNQTSVF